MSNQILGSPHHLGGVISPFLSIHNLTIDSVARLRSGKAEILRFRRDNAPYLLATSESKLGKSTDLIIVFVQ